MTLKRGSVETGTSLSSSSSSEISPAKRRRVEAEDYARDEITPAGGAANRVLENNGWEAAGSDHGFIDDEVDCSSVTNEGDSDDDSEQAQRVRKELEERRQHGFAETGILESIKVENFMCHRRFELSLGPNVNIINGRNGSGKSAVVAALQLGLGARAKATERANKLEDHIMHGENSASIRIKVRNRPLAGTSTTLDQYKEHLYGESITIERKLVRGGGGSWAIKDSRGKNVKLPKGRTARQEVTDIVDYFGFQVDNPVAVLTQTKSKEFLQSGRATDRYNFFMASTRLADLNETIKAIVGMTKQVSTIVQQKETIQPVVAEQMGELKSAYEDAIEMRTINERIERAELEYAWTVADEKGALLEEYKEKTKGFENTLDAAKLAQEKLSKNVEDLEITFAKVQRDLEDMTNKVRASKKAHNNLIRQKKSAEHELDEKKRRLKRTEREINRCLRSRGEAEQRLEKARAVHNRKAASRSTTVHSHQERAAELEGTSAAVKEADEGELMWGEKLRHLQERKHQLDSTITHLDSQYREVHRELDHISRSRKGSIARWGRDMPAILQAIKHAVARRQISVPPIGPLGEHISVLDKSWARAIQTCIGLQTLSSFLVNSAADSDALKNMFKTMRRNRQIERIPMITITKFKCRKYGNLNVPAVHKDGHATILDVVKIGSDPVFNVLVDFSKIERHVLLNDESLMDTYPYLPIPNMDMCWDKSGARAWQRFGSRAFRGNPNPSAVVVLTSSMDELIADKTAQMHCVKEQLEAKRREIREHEQRVMRMRTEYDRARSWKQNLREKARALRTQIQDLEEQLSAAHEDFDSSPYEEEIGARSHEIQEEERTKVALEASVSELEVRVRDATTAVTEHKRASCRLLARNQQKHDEVEQVYSDVSRLKAALDNKRREVHKAQVVVDGAHKEVGMATNEHRNALRGARLLGTRPESMQGLDSEALEREIKAMRRRADEERERHDGKSAEELEIEWRRAQIKERNNSTALKRIKSYSVALKKGYLRRDKEKRQLYRTTKMLVRLHFQAFLQSRGHTGTMKCSNSELELVVKMANHKKYGGNDLYETRDMRSLSGGERSYTTLSFMIALGNVMDVPTRVMDEFDVFMDEANRRAAYETVIEFCSKLLPDKQFIFITPLELPNVKSTEAVRILKLAAPRNYQRSQ